PPHRPPEHRAFRGGESVVADGNPRDGSRLLREAEQHAKRHGTETLRLDTRDDLVEACALYARHGYSEIPAYSRRPYACTGSRSGSHDRPGRDTRAVLTGSPSRRSRWNRFSLPRQQNGLG